jgi:hypothetical protein
MDDIRRLAIDLDRFLDRLLGEVDLSSAEPDGLRHQHAQPSRRAQLERYIGGMSTAQRLRLAGALHLLSDRLDNDLAHPDQRAAPHEALGTPERAMSLATLHDRYRETRRDPA